MNLLPIHLSYNVSNTNDSHSSFYTKALLLKFPRYQASAKNRSTSALSLFYGGFHPLRISARLKTKSIFTPGIPRSHIQILHEQLEPKFWFCDKLLLNTRFPVFYDSTALKCSPYASKNPGNLSAHPDQRTAYPPPDCSVETRCTDSFPPSAHPRSASFFSTASSDRFRCDGWIRMP